MNTPYYQDDAVTIYHGDCREIIPDLDFDVIVTDPPYGINLDTDYTKLPGGVANRSVNRPVAGDAEAFDPAPFVAGPCALFGVNHYARLLPDGGTWHVWDKRDGMPSGGLMADFELWWTNYPSGSSSVFRYQWQGFMRAGERGAVRQHPTQKPLSLMTHIATSAPPGVILDPFMGSGTTLRAAKDLGRKAIGIELDEKYCEIAAKRMAQGVLDFGAAA